MSIRSRANLGLVLGLLAAAASRGQSADLGLASRDEMDVARDVRLVALTPREERAVVRVGAGPLVVVGPGDVVPGTAAEVVLVEADRLVLEERSPGREIWLFLPVGAGERGEVRVVDFEIPASTVAPGLVLAPMTALSDSADPVDDEEAPAVEGETGEAVDEAGGGR